MGKHYLPSKLSSYLLRLSREYSKDGRALELEIITTCRALAIEDTDHDGYNSEAIGHDARLYLPLETHEKIELARLNKIADAICNDLNELAWKVPNEYFRAVHLELEDEGDPDLQRSVPFATPPPLDPDKVGIWRPGLVRLFISHRDIHKRAANELADALEPLGISSFVAHDTIRPKSEWRKEITKGLETMEVMLAFLTDDFESTWTNQEVGYALGKRIPIISLKLGKLDPPGFISHEQALKGNPETLPASAEKLYALIAKAVGKSDRLQEALVTSFVSAPDWGAARDRFERLRSTVSTLTDEQVAAIIEGFYRNDQLHFAVYLVNRHNRLQKFLEASTAYEFVIEGRTIRRVTPSTLDDDVPF